MTTSDSDRRSYGLNYQTPPFPSLYGRPINPEPGEARFLLYTTDIWRFTLYWTLIFYSAAHGAVAAYTLLVQHRNWKVVGWAVPLGFALIAGLEALMAGSIVGLVLGAIYEAGNFKMSTWIPLIWAALNTLVLILSSFSIQGGL
ncbi:hypothetical protein KEM52_002609 [Ascosphaera acerosa]|nr:hypothetical protein KEM52_002609 [Ascosphaera acerosa]